MFRVFAPAVLLGIAAAIGLAPAATAAGPYANCGEADRDGVCNITQDSPYYLAKLDRDDGIGCEC